MKTAFDNGYTAFMGGLPYDPFMSQEWRNGWKQAEAHDHSGHAEDVVSTETENA